MLIASLLSFSIDFLYKKVFLKYPAGGLRLDFIYTENSAGPRLYFIYTKNSGRPGGGDLEENGYFLQVKCGLPFEGNERWGRSS